MRPQKQPHSAIRRNKNPIIYPLQAGDNAQINRIQIYTSLHLPVGA